jgi:hypothetical protein
MQENFMVMNRGKNIYRINTWLELVLIGTISALISGCASTALETRSYRSHEIGKQATAGVGTPMLISEEGTIEKKRRWVGISNSPDGWETIGTTYSDDFNRKELIYQGRTGSTIKVTFRLFRAGSVMPEQQEDLMFNLLQSTSIIVKDFRLKVFKADENSITYMVIKD